MHYDVADEDGAIIAYVLINLDSHSLDMHCLKHGKGCSTGRTYLSFPVDEGKRLTPLRESRGRCLVFLTVWARWRSRFTGGEADRDAHVEASKCKGEASVLGDGTSAERQEARLYVESADTLAEPRSYERQLRPDEPLEPELF